MALAFYMDENVHGAITTGLRLRNVDVLTVQEDGASGIPDSEVMERAIALNRLLFSQDSDLLVEGVRYQSEGIAFPGVVYARQTVVSIGVCIRDLELIAQLGTAEEFVNRVQYLPL